MLPLEFWHEWKVGRGSLVFATERRLVQTVQRLGSMISLAFKEGPVSETCAPFLPDAETPPTPKSATGMSALTLFFSFKVRNKS